MTSYLVTGIHCVARVTFNSLIFLSHLQSSGITGLSHQTQFKELLIEEKIEGSDKKIRANLGVRHKRSGFLVIAFAENGLRWWALSFTWVNGSDNTSHGFLVSRTVC